MNAILGEMGHRVDFAESGETAIEAAARGGYDAILMDIALPGLDGLEATRRIRALPGKAGQVTVIGISGRSDKADESAARQAGMNFYFAKPVNSGGLAQTLNGIIARPRESGDSGKG
jgi:CheY-like chemotaxis protein